MHLEEQFRNAMPYRQHILRNMLFSLPNRGVQRFRIPVGINLIFEIGLKAHDAFHSKHKNIQQHKHLAGQPAQERNRNLCFLNSLQFR